MFIATAGALLASLALLPGTPVDVCPEGTTTVVVDATEVGGTVEVGCAADPTTGTEALNQAGFTETRDGSGLICAIADRPDPCPEVFTGSYWSYWSAEIGGEWQVRMEGPDTAAPAPAEGWRYGDGTQPPGIEPEAGPSDESDDDGAPAELSEATGAAPAPTGASLPVLIGGAGVLVLAAAAVWARRRPAR